MICPKCHSNLKKIKVDVEDAKTKAISYQCPKCDYFTFEPKSKTHDPVFREILQFLNVLPELHKELFKLSVENFDKIDFKIPITLRNLIQTPDSVIIYYRNKDLSGVIRKTTETIFLRRCIKFANRFFRVNSGFDFDGENLSHSMLISQVLANHILKHYDEFLFLSENELIPWLKSSILECNKWTEEQIYGAL